MALKIDEHGSYSVLSERSGGAFDRVERDEIYSGIRRGILDGLSNNQIALRVGVCDRTVLRYRRRHGLPNYYGRTTL